MHGVSLTVVIGWDARRVNDITLTHCHIARSLFLGGKFHILGNFDEAKF